MTTSYPSGIDNFTNPTSTDTLSSATVPHASEHANANDAIKAIETELGTNPKGSYASVAARLAASTGSITTWRKAASGGETSLTGTDDFSTTLAYTVGQEQVFINGVLLERGVDYTASTGSSITGLTALVAGDIATVISVGTFNVANAIPLSTVTAKGDLIAANGSGTVTNLPVGADGTTLVANSAASTGVSWSGGNAVPNPVINSCFDIWQRGTSIANNATYTLYSADRWQVNRGGLQTGVTVSQQATGDTTNLPNVRYAARVQRNSGDTGTGGIAFLTSLETSNSISFVGKQVTVSFYARAGANFSASSNILTARLDYGTGTDQSLGGGFTGQTAVINTNATLTTTWQRFSYTATVPTSANQLGFWVQYVPTGTAGANDYFDITGVQIDLGPVALPVRRNGSTLQGELAACQRYYIRYTEPSGTRFPAIGYAQTTTAARFLVTFPVQMRVAPSSLEQTGSAGDYAIGYLNTAAVCNSSVPSQLNTSVNGATIQATLASGLTAGVGTELYAQNANAYLGWSAEL